MTTAPPGLIEKFESWDQENRRLSEKRESKIAWSPKVRLRICGVKSSIQIEIGSQLMILRTLL